MADTTFLDWPFFEQAHRQLAERAEAWASKHLAGAGHVQHDVDRECRRLLGELANGGWLRYSVPGEFGGALPGLDVRSLCLLREILARHQGLADFVFAMQGLGSGPISLFGSQELKQRYLPAVSKGTSCAAFALSEPGAGSDVGALSTTAIADGEDYVLDGCKTWISNGGIADFYTVFARAPNTSGSSGISCFVVDARSAGCEITERIDLIAPHPMAKITFDRCRIPGSQLVGETGKGFKIAMATLDVFRSTVGAAALGFARRALDEAVGHARQRHMFGGRLADLQLTQASIGEMALDIDASALLVYRSAWTKDCRSERVTREAAMAKYFATEAAQGVIDKALQLHGGLGVVTGTPVEVLYREIRALRIYEGASEVQKTIIARQLLADR
jgi:acyl-CoA dehydrogenase